MALGKNKQIRTTEAKNKAKSQTTKKKMTERENYRLALRYTLKESLGERSRLLK